MIFLFVFMMRMEAQIIRKNIKQELAKVVSDENNGGLFLQYQPILDLRTNRISNLRY